MKKFKKIAQLCQWHKSVNNSYLDDCESQIEKLQKTLPSGSGINNGCEIDIENSGINKVIIKFTYDFMNERGFYTVRKSYKLILTPDFSTTGFRMKIIGANKDYIKYYFYDLFQFDLTNLDNY